MSVEADSPLLDTPAVTPRAARPRKKSPARFIVPVLLVAIIALVASTMRAGQGALVYSKYVDEVLVAPGRFVGQDLRVEGTVTAGSVQNTSGSREFRFRVERNNREMPVHYTGIVPDTFREGIGVTVRGRLGADGTFEAREVVAKCPSKYEMQAARARGESMPSGMLPVRQR